MGRLFRKTKTLTGALGLSMLVGGVDVSCVSKSPSISFWRVSGNSCSPVLEDGDRLLVTNLTEKDVRDMVLVKYDGEVLVKMLIGKPGDVVKGDRDGFYCNDDLILRGDSGPFKKELGQDEYFLLGPNYKTSLDSRLLGPFSKKSFIGEVIYNWHSNKSEDVYAKSR